MAWTTTVEDCRAIGVNDFNREGLLTPGARGSATWTRESDGEEVASIGWAVDGDRASTAEVLRLFYTVTDTRTEDSREIGYRVEALAERPTL